MAFASSSAFVCGVAGAAQAQAFFIGGPAGSGDPEIHAGDPPTQYLIGGGCYTGKSPPYEPDNINSYQAIAPGVPGAYLVPGGVSYSGGPVVGWSATNQPYETQTISVDSSVPVGNYNLYIGGDSTENDNQMNPCYYYPNQNGVGNYDDDFAFLFTVAMTGQSNRLNFTQYSISASPATALFDGTQDWFWEGPTTPTISAGTLSETASVYDYLTSTSATSCYAKTGSVTVKMFTNCPIAQIKSPSGHPVESLYGGQNYTFTLEAPNNPSHQQFNPGQLTFINVLASYLDNGVFFGFWDQWGSDKAIAVMGTTDYVTTEESTFGFPQDAGGCESITHTVHGVKVMISGSSTGAQLFGPSSPYASGVFCNAWANYFVELQGSGIFENPIYTWNGRIIKMKYGNPYIVVTKATPLYGTNNDELHPQPGQTGDTGHSFARDFTIIPAANPAPMTMLTDQSGQYAWAAGAADTGGAFVDAGENDGMGYAHIDLYLGEVDTVSQGFTSPMVLLGCDTPPGPPASLASVLTTLCPSDSTWTSIFVDEQGQNARYGDVVRHNNPRNQNHPKYVSTAPSALSRTTPYRGEPTSPDGYYSLLARKLLLKGIIQ